MAWQFKTSTLRASASSGYHIGLLVGLIVVLLQISDVRSATTPAPTVAPPAQSRNVFSPCATADDCAEFTGSICDNNLCVCDNTASYYFNYKNDTCEFGFGSCTPPDGDECAIFTQTMCSPEGQCVCDTDINFEYDTTLNKCVQYTGIQGLCDVDLTVCTLENTECLSDGDGMGTYRCICPQTKGFIQVEAPDGNQTCAYVLSRMKNDSCEECESNEGTCYSYTDSTQKDGCKCKVSRSGVDCSITHVDLTCNRTLFTMDICYMAHDDVNFTAGAEMFVLKYGDKPACVASTDPEMFDFCDPDIYQAELRLFLHPGEIEECGTTPFASDIRKMKYQSTINIQKTQDEVSDDIVFNTYCEFNTFQQASAGVGLIGGPQNDRGESLTPNLKLGLTNSLGQVIPEGVALRLGDRIRFKLTLVPDGTYAAIKVERCSASNSGSLPASNDIVVDLLIEGCPVADNNVFSVDNNWGLVQNREYELQTGLVPTFKLRQGNVVFIHCTIKLCLEGEEEECEPESCRDSASSSGRRKRQADTGTPASSTNVSRKIILFEDERPGDVVMDKAMFGVMIGVLAALLIIFTIAAVILFMKLRRSTKMGQKTDEVNLTHKPQRFTVPRIPRPTMRM